ncbi:MAG: response regulator [Pseudomonadota bacterium]
MLLRGRGVGAADGEEDEKMEFDLMEGSGFGLGRGIEPGDGAAAGEKLERAWGCLALTERNLPGMDGKVMVEVMRGREDTAKTPVMVMLTDGKEGRRRRLGEMGMRSYLTKPLALEHLRVKWERGLWHGSGEAGKGGEWERGAGAGLGFTGTRRRRLELSLGEAEAAGEAVMADLSNQVRGAMLRRLGLRLGEGESGADG